MWHQNPFMVFMRLYPCLNTFVSKKGPNKQKKLKLKLELLSGAGMKQTKEQKVQSKSLELHDVNKLYQSNNSTIFNLVSSEKVLCCTVRHGHSLKTNDKLREL